jgi:hypothetical protein
MFLNAVTYGDLIMINVSLGSDPESESPFDIQILSPS